MCWGETHYFYKTGSYRLAFYLCSENSTFYPSKGVNLRLCLSSHEATTRVTTQLGRRCLDAVPNPFSHPAFPDTFRSICISLAELAGLRSHSLKAKMGSQINHTDHKIVRSSSWSDLELCFPFFVLVHLPDQHHVFRIPAAVSGSPCLDWHRTSPRGQQTVHLPSQSLWWSWCRQPPVWHSWRHLQGCMEKRVQYTEAVLHFTCHS